MSKKELIQEWVKMSDSWIKEAREGENFNRKGLLDKPMLEACGNVKGMKILDCGCGEGRFCRLLTKRGASYVLGIDNCPPMIKAAQGLQEDRIEYRIADAENLFFIGDKTFDIAVSYLNQCDLPEFKKNNREVFRVLKKDGHFIIANLHPMRSAGGGWCKDEDGRKLHVSLDNYFDEGKRHWNMMGVDFTNFHRSLSTYISSFFDIGFTLKKIIEPTVTKKQVIKCPELSDERRVPNFIIYILEK